LLAFMYAQNFDAEKHFAGLNAIQIFCALFAMLFGLQMLRKSFRK
jgi:hypothetical protein